MNPSLVARYLFRNLAVSTLDRDRCWSAWSTWLIESLKFFELAINGGAPLQPCSCEMVMLAMPPIVAVVLPIIFFVVIIFVYNKMTAESELIVLRALGPQPMAAGDAGFRDGRPGRAGHGVRPECLSSRHGPTNI